jgi:hypothetical protein
MFTNIQGEEHFQPTDRFFVGGEKEMYLKLIEIVKDFNAK